MRQIKVSILVFFLNILVVIIANGQSLVFPGKTWIYLLVDENPDSKPNNDECLQIGADTIISNTAYFKLMYSLGCNESYLKIKGFIRETKDSLVFYLPKNSSAKEFLLYNFGINVGDSVYSTPVPSRLDSISKTFKGQKIYHLSGMNNFKDKWIEGVGSEMGLLMELITGGSQIFTCCLLNRENLYHNPVYNTCFYTSAERIKDALPKFKVYPNPVSDELYVQQSSTENEGYALALFTVKGELVITRCMEPGINPVRLELGNLKSGIYLLRLISASGKYDEEVILKN